MSERDYISFDEANLKLMEPEEFMGAVLDACRRTKDHSILVVIEQQVADDE